jgi:hypothetical protein
MVFVPYRKCTYGPPRHVREQPYRKRTYGPPRHVREQPYRKRTYGPPRHVREQLYFYQLLNITLILFVHVFAARKVFCLGTPMTYVRCVIYNVYSDPIDLKHR